MTSTLLPTASAQRMPMSVIGSIALHGAAVGLYVYAAQLSARQRASVPIQNVDLIMVKKALPATPAAAKPAPAPQKMLDFFKLALPAIPKVQQQQFQVKTPAHELKMQTPKLEDRGRVKQLEKLQALNMDARKPELNTLDVGKVQTRRSSMEKLAAMPKLEEVGRHQVKNLPAAIKLDEQRQEAQAMMRMNVLTTPTHRAMAPVSETLHEAGPPENALANKIKSMLPTQPPALELKPEMRAADDTLSKKTYIEEKLDKRGSAEMLPEKKKGVELEGPIKNRKIVSYDVPEFPQWAKDQQILEAAVAIRFWVSPEGGVLDNMRIETSSGYGRLDHEAMDALKNWKFAPLPGNERQWGVITFRFVLE